MDLSRECTDFESNCVRILYCVSYRYVSDHNASVTASICQEISASGKEYTSAAMKCQ